MASTLISNVNSESEYQANLLTNTPNRVKVIVEDEVDVVVWHRILKRFAPAYKFEISPYSYGETGGSKGKAHIIANAANLGQYMIGCVDSDYDWVLRQWTTDGQVISSNQFILETYAYSLENLALQPYGKSDGMLECTIQCCDLQRNLDKESESFLEDLSAIVYDVVVWHLLMRKERVGEDRISIGWDYLLNNAHYDSVRRDASMPLMEKRRELLKMLTARVVGLVDTYNTTYPGLRTMKSEFAELVKREGGLVPGNAYLFVRGHNLYDFMVHNFFEPVAEQLKRDHQQEILTRLPQIVRKNALAHYKKLVKDFGTDCLQRAAYLEDDSNCLTQSMKAAVATIFP